MECVSPEQMAAYLRGRGNGEFRALEDHVRDCPACAMELLLARETLHELKVKGRPATERLRMPRRPGGSWIPWAAAAVVLVALLLYAIQPSNPAKGKDTAVGPHPVPVAPKQPEIPVPDKHVGESPKPEPKPPTPEPPKPKPEPFEIPPPVVPKPAPKPEPDPVKPPEVPKPVPDPEPKKSSPTVPVAPTVVAKVLRSVGTNVAGKTIAVGDTLATGRQEFVEVSYEGYGTLYFRENSRVDLGLNGEINLHDGEMLAKIDSGRRLGLIKTPAAEIELQATLFDIQASKTATEISVVEGHAAVGAVVAKGPMALVAKTGKSAEARPLDPGFASWVPDKLAGKKFVGWFEGESFTALQGFKVMEQDAASGRRAAVQVAEQGTAAFKAALPFKGRHLVWLRVRQYETKATSIGLQINGQTVGEGSLKIDAAAGKPWRWLGPFAVNSDRLDLAVAALSRNPLANPDRNSFPVVLDTVFVTSDVKATPPEKLPEERRAFELILDEPAK
jgi:ferric-dicitrate binding protein FerR (iron transport regulator)